MVHCGECKYKGSLEIFYLAIPYLKCFCDGKATVCVCVCVYVCVFSDAVGLKTLY